MTNSVGIVVNDAVLETRDIAKDLYTSAQGELSHNFILMKTQALVNIIVGVIR